MILPTAALAMTATLPGRTHGVGLITKPLIADLKLTEVAFGDLNFWSIILGATFCWPGLVFLAVAPLALILGAAAAFVPQPVRPPVQPVEQPS